MRRILNKTIQVPKRAHEDDPVALHAPDTDKCEQFIQNVCKLFVSPRCTPTGLVQKCVDKLHGDTYVSDQLSYTMILLQALQVYRVLESPSEMGKYFENKNTMISGLLRLLGLLNIVFYRNYLLGIPRIIHMWPAKQWFCSNPYEDRIARTASHY